MGRRGRSPSVKCVVGCECNSLRVLQNKIWCRQSLHPPELPSALEVRRSCQSDLVRLRLAHGVQCRCGSCFHCEEMIDQAYQAPFHRPSRAEKSKEITPRLERTNDSPSMQQGSPRVSQVSAGHSALRRLRTSHANECHCGSCAHAKEKLDRVTIRCTAHPQRRLQEDPYQTWREWRGRLHFPRSE